MQYHWFDESEGQQDCNDLTSHSIYTVFNAINAPTTDRIWYAIMNIPLANNSEFCIQFALGQNRTIWLRTCNRNSFLEWIRIV